MKNIKVEKSALEVLIRPKLLIGKCLFISKTYKTDPNLYQVIFELKEACWNNSEPR